MDGNKMFQAPNMISKKVAVIGAGASGLTAIKCCLDEGLDVVCFERTDSIGGLWHYTEEVRDGQACVMRSTVINTSKEVMCFSDFPIPKESAIFMHNTAVMRYFHSYADKFKLKERIQYNTEVLMVAQSKNFHDNGQWDIKWHNKLTNETREETFTAVLICTGHHAEINMPDFPGIKDFKGKVLHSHDYKHTAGFDGKRVLIVGIGNSAIDTAVELSRATSQLFLSTRRGAWVFSKTGKRGLPSDMQFSRALISFAGNFPNLTSKFLKKDLQNHLDHRLYSLEPEHSPFQQHPTVSDEFPSRIMSGSVTVKADVKRFTDTGVEFLDGTFEDNIDAVILATGYVFGFPFLDKTVLDVKNNKVDLYKRMFPTTLSHPTLAIVGCVQPLGSVIPISEMQCRVATRVVKGLVTLPSRDVMEAEVSLGHSIMKSRYVNTQRHTIQVDFIPYMDELATLIGCKPDLRKMILLDPKLFISCFFGPCTPIQYRLMGPGSWSGARETILSTWDRVYYPLQTRPLPPVKRDSGPSGIKIALLIAVVAFVLYYVLSV